MRIIFLWILALICKFSYSTENKNKLVLRNIKMPAGNGNFVYRKVLIALKERPKYNKFIYF